MNACLSSLIKNVGLGFKTYDKNICKINIIKSFAIFFQWYIFIEKSITSKNNMLCKPIKLK